MDNEFSSDVSFEEFQKTDRYKEIIDESKISHPHIDEITIILLVSLWYKQDVLKEEIEVTVKPEKQTEYDTKQVSVYDAKEHLEKYGDVFKAPLITKEITEEKTE